MSAHKRNASVTELAASAILSTASSLSDLVYASSARLPSAPDGLYDHEAGPLNDGKSKRHAFIHEFIDGIQSQIKRGAPIHLTSSTLSSLVDALQNGNSVGLDDRKMLLETLIVFMSRLPEGSSLARTVQDNLITLLYKDLPHPPTAFIGKEHAYRTADGANNNPMFPDLGRAGQPYGRTVSSTHPLPPTSLPEPGLIFDTLLQRDKFTPHPSGISSLLFHFAEIIIHDIFRTSHPQWTHNDSSSYLDLSPLYGGNQKEQDTVRLKDGRGRLHEDTFAQVRMLSSPPGVAALLVLFCRNHNYVAEKLLQINEQRTFSDPPPTDPAQLAEQDDEIFGKARLINCGLYMNIIVTDYISAILGTVRDVNKWSLDPFSAIREGNHDPLPRGQGNAVSVEFNLLYRWHATLSEADTKWMEGMFANLFPGKTGDQVSTKDFQLGARKLAMSADPDPRKWKFGGLTRDPQSGRFTDEGLGNIIYDSTENVASAFKARGTPAAMRVIEIMSIEQSRKWGVCSLNEFRKFMGLKPYETFLDWNSNLEVANAALRLYQHPDNLELYVGLQAEQTKSPVDGSGLCPGFTISRAILSDAVSLVRGDRFYTIDHTPYNLTAWGYRDCTPSKTITGLTKLLLRTLPRSYSFNSVYAHFAMVTPQIMRAHLEKQNCAELYDFRRPATQAAVKVIKTLDGVQTVLRDRARFKAAYGGNMRQLTSGLGFSTFVGPPGSRRTLITTALSEPGAIPDFADYFERKALALINSNSFSTSSGRVLSIDIVRDVINLIPVHWVCSEVAGIPLKTKNTPRGLHTEQEMFTALSDIFGFIFLNVENEHVWGLREKATKAATLLLDNIKGRLESLSGTTLSVHRLRDSFTHWLTGQEDHSDAFLKRLLSSGTDVDEIANGVLALIVATSASWARAATQVVHFYIEEERASEKAKIVAASLRQDAQSEGILIGYVREALRLDSQVAGVYRQAMADMDVLDGSEEISVNKGDTVFASVSLANVDVDHFGSNPKVVDPTRPRLATLLFGDGLHNFMGDDFSEKTIAQVLRRVFSLKNLRRAPGYSGQLNRITHTISGAPQHLYIDFSGRITPWPSSLILQYED